MKLLTSTSFSEIMLTAATIVKKFQNEFTCYLQLFRIQSCKPSLPLLIFFVEFGLSPGKEDDTD